MTTRCTIPQFVGGTTLLACALAFISSAKGSDLPRSNEVPWHRTIRNDQLSWDGNFLGLSPRLDERASKLLAEIRDDEIPLLLAALRDDERFAIAHVLLTRRFAKSYTLSAREWNGLEVTLYGDGTCEYAPAAAERVRRHWERWYAERRQAGK